MSRFMIFLLFCAWASLAQAIPRELIVVSGGPAVRFFEKNKEHTHDLHWGNFIDSGVIRLQQLKESAAAGDQVSWLVYRPGYVDRGKEMSTDLVAVILEKANQMGVSLFWFDTTNQLINYLNHGKDRSVMPIGNFDYFGHSNKVCFLFDYSNLFDSMSVVYLHDKNLQRIGSDIFEPTATCKSWGCHTGEYFSEQWKRRTGVPMTGAIGKTDYSKGGLPILSTENGRWTQ